MHNIHVHNTVGSSNVTFGGIQPSKLAETKPIKRDITHELQGSKPTMQSWQAIAAETEIPTVDILLSVVQSCALRLYYSTKFWEHLDAYQDSIIVKTIHDSAVRGLYPHRVA